MDILLVFNSSLVIIIIVNLLDLLEIQVEIPLLGIAISKLTSHHTRLVGSLIDNFNDFSFQLLRQLILCQLLNDLWVIKQVMMCHRIIQILRGNPVSYQNLVSNISILN
jgi:hypothetical protein